MIKVFVKRDTGESLVIDGSEVYYTTNEFVEMQSFDTTPSEYKDIVRNCCKQSIDINEDGHLVIGRNNPLEFREFLAMPEHLLCNALEKGKALVFVTTKGNYATNQSYKLFPTKYKNSICYVVFELNKLKQVRVKGVKND